MKRLVWHGRNAVELEDEERRIPEPKRDEVLVKIRSVGICGTDIHILKGRSLLSKPPLVLGHEIAGEIACVGSNAGSVREGDRVTVDSVVGCGHCPLCRRGSTQFCANGYELGISRDGGCQEYLIVPRRNVYRIPDRISFEQGAILDIEVYNAILKCRIELGDCVLVLGAGPIGLIACQVARLFGAGRITLADPIAERLAAAEQLGISDAYHQPAAEATDDSAHEQEQDKYDVVIDCAGIAQSTRYALDSLRPGGKALLYGVYEEAIENLDLNRIVLRDLVLFGAQSDRRNWEDVIEMVANQRLNLEGLITHRFPLEEGMRAYDLVSRRADGVIKAVLVLEETGQYGRNMCHLGGERSKTA